MDLDTLIRYLQQARIGGNSEVLVGTPSQVLRGISGQRASWRLGIADGAGLGDQEGECDSLFLILVRE